MYILKMMDGEKFTITPQEFVQIGRTKGSVYIKSCDAWINMASVSTIYPEYKADEVEDRKGQMVGVLHDGTPVRRHFGEWVDATREVPDDKGNYQVVKLDPTYYPEIAIDCVPTPKEFQKKYKALSSSERLTLIMHGKDIKRLKGEPAPISKLLE